MYEVAERAGGKLTRMRSRDVESTCRRKMNGTKIILFASRDVLWVAQSLKSPTEATMVRGLKTFREDLRAGA